MHLIVSGPVSTIFCLPPPEARVFGRIVLVARLAFEHPARAELGAKFRVLWIVNVFRLFFRVQVLEVAEELIEAVNGRQEVVAISQMISAKLPGGVAHRLEQLGDCRVLVGQSLLGTRQADLEQAGSEAALFGDERSASGRAGLRGVEVKIAPSLTIRSIECNWPFERVLLRWALVARADLGLNMSHQLTFRELTARPIVLKLERPIVARIATFTEWPAIVIDLYTDEGVVGRSYLEPYLPNAMRYLIPALRDLNEALKGRRMAPMELYDAGRKSLHFVGYQGLSMIAVAGVDMAAWDALSKAAGLPLCAFLGGSVGSVPAYNSSGLWLQNPELVAQEAVKLLEGGFKALKLRLGRAKHNEDLATIEAVRAQIGDDIELMVDYNQSLTFSDAIERCHAIDDLGLAWIEEPMVYDNFEGHARLAAELRTPLQIGENFYGPRDLYTALQMKACDFVMPDFMRIGGVTGWLRAVPIAAAAGIPVSTHLYPEVAAHMMRVTETAHWLEWQDWVNPLMKEPFEIRDGHVHIPGRPGIGIEWDEHSIRKHTV